MDGKELTNPVVQQAITGGKATISGSQSLEEAKDLAILLRSGALPVKINVLEVRTVGPSLGQDSKRQIHSSFQCWYCDDHDFLGYFISLIRYRS